MSLWLLAAEINYFGYLAPSDVVVWPEVGAIGWRDTWLANTTTVVAVDDTSPIEALGISIKSRSRRNVLEGLARHGLIEVESESRHLGQLTPGYIVVGLEARVACRATAGVATNDARIVHRLNVLIEGRATEHVREVWSPCRIDS